MTLGNASRNWHVKSWALLKKCLLQVIHALGGYRLKHPFESFDYPDAQGFNKITQHLPEGVKKCRFISETEEHDLPVFDVAAHRIVEILSQCSLFEYYLVGKGYDWLLIENDHNEIIFSRVPGPD